MGELQAELRELPPQPETEADRSRLLNRIVSQIRDDLARRIRAEFMSAEPSDRHLAIAPIVASMVQDFKSQLLKKNPDWLGEAMIEEVDYTVRNFAAGYTVDNLTGRQVFINLIKQTFIDEGLLKHSVHGLVTDVGEHLRSVVMHVIEVHANNHPILSNRLDAKAEDCIDQLTVKAQDVCGMLAEAQQVTSTTHGAYMLRLTEFRKWLQDQKDGGTDTLATALRGAEGQVSEVPAEFLTLVKEAQKEPRKLMTIEICASLHVYTGLMIEGFVESSAKLVKFNMVEQLADKLEEIWREDLGALDELFPTDKTLALKKEDLTRKIDELSGFKAGETGTPSVLRNIGMVRRGFFLGNCFFLAFFFSSGFWLLAFGFWLLAFGSFRFWLLACICCILEPICMPIWLLALASLDSWLLVFVVFFFGFGFTWLLAFGRTSVECMCSIVVCI